MIVGKQIEKTKFVVSMDEETLEELKFLGECHWKPWTAAEELAYLVWCWMKRRLCQVKEGTILERDRGKWRPIKSPLRHRMMVALAEKGPMCEKDLRRASSCRGKFNFYQSMKFSLEAGRIERREDGFYRLGPNADAEEPIFPITEGNRNRLERLVREARERVLARGFSKNNRETPDWVRRKMEEKRESIERLRELSRKRGEETKQQIMQAMASEDCMSLLEIGQSSSVPARTIRYHLGDLIQKGLVQIEGGNRNRRYRKIHIPDDYEISGMTVKRNRLERKDLREEILGVIPVDRWVKMSEVCELSGKNITTTRFYVQDFVDAGELIIRGAYRNRMYRKVDAEEEAELRRLQEEIEGWPGGR
jgi:predicted transcriptional regulator